MKSKLLIVVIVILALGVGLWTASRVGGNEQVELVPAWQLTPQKMYSGECILDPCISWSSDSKSLLMGASSAKTFKNWIFRWNVGDLEIEKVAEGFCPNVVDKDTFLYFLANPTTLMEHSFSRGTDKAIVRSFKQVDFWKDITSFSYIPATKTLGLRFCSFTRYCEPALEEVDLTGKPLRKLPRLTGAGVLDRSTDPDNRQVAEIVGELTGGDRILQVSTVGSTGKGKQITNGNLGCVAWSPNGQIIAFSDASEVKATRPDGKTIVLAARFPTETDSSQSPYVCRLYWSPDSRYLAAVQVVPHLVSGDMMVYVLDMSKLKF